MCDSIREAILKSYVPPPVDIVEQLRNSRRWRETDGKEGARFDIAFESKPDLDLAAATLSDACLQDASLVGARLDGADLSGALANGLRLDGAQCIGADFTKAALVEASFAGAIVRL